MPYFFHYPSLEQGIFPPHAITAPAPDSKESFYSLLRLHLASCIESFSVNICNKCITDLSGADHRRDFSLIARVEKRQFLSFSRMAIDRPDEFHKRLIHLLVLLIDSGAWVTQQLKDCSVRQAIDFLLPEFQDILYRLSNYLLLSRHVKAESFLFGSAEIMPGRPMIACHRHPYDDILQACDREVWQIHLYLMIMIAIIENISFLLDGRISQADTQLEGEFLCEISLLFLQYRSVFSSLLSNLPIFFRALQCQYAEYYIYDSLYRQESDPALKEIFRSEREHEESHIAKVSSFLTGDKQIIPDSSSLPPPFQLHSQKGYVRETIQNVGTTLSRGKVAPVGSLKKGADFFRFQKRIASDPSSIPSHQIIQKIISINGTDYRYMIAPHPIELLRSCSQDATDIGR